MDKQRLSKMISKNVLYPEKIWAKTTFKSDLKKTSFPQNIEIYADMDIQNQSVLLTCHRGT